MTTTTDDDRPERAWGVASVPAYPHPSAKASLSGPPGGNVLDRSEPTTGSMRTLAKQFSIAPQHPSSPPASPPSSPPASPPTSSLPTPGRFATGSAKVGLLPPAGAPAARSTPVPPAATPSAPGSAPPRSRSDRHRRVEKVSRGRRVASRLRTIAVVGALLVAAGAGGYQIIRQRLADQAFVNLGGVLLTADAVPVGFAEAVVVTTVGVASHQHVTAGQKLATATTAVGRAETLIAPAAGTVAAVKVGVGGVARGGEPIVTLYDQARLTFQADVPLTDLRRMRVGMTVYIEGPGLSRGITATLDHVVPVVGDPVAATDKLTVVLKPTDADRDMVSTLVPGLRFDARVDTNSAPGAVAAVNTG